MISPDRLALVLDTPDLRQAKALVKTLGNYFGVLKIGLTLWAAAGPKAVKSLKSSQHQIFCDLKLHDIPNQVEGAARELSKLGVDFVTLHSAGGTEMLRRGVSGLGENIKALAVTVLTSQSEVKEADFIKLVTLSAEAGCVGVVCSPQEVLLAKQTVPDIFCATPGIRMADADTHDQARVATPKAALLAGADLLVIGRAVTQAPDPLASVKLLLKDC